jgi:acyl-CoA-binding protein
VVVGGDERVHWPGMSKDAAKEAYIALINELSGKY